MLIAAAGVCLEQIILKSQAMKYFCTFQEESLLLAGLLGVNLLASVNLLAFILLVREMDHSTAAL